MARSRSDSPRPVFPNHGDYSQVKMKCPICGGNVVFAKIVPGYARDSKKAMIPVDRVIFLCTGRIEGQSCGNVIAFLKRKDGRKGELHTQLDLEKQGLRRRRTTKFE